MEGKILLYRRPALCMIYSAWNNDLFWRNESCVPFTFAFEPLKTLTALQSSEHLILEGRLLAKSRKERTPKQGACSENLKIIMYENAYSALLEYTIL